MSHPILLSDDEDRIVLDTPLPVASKKRRKSLDADPNPQVLILVDDPTPQKPGSSSTPSFVAETPLSDFAFVKCQSKKTHFSDDPQNRATTSEPTFPGISGVIQLESDSESDSSKRQFLEKNEPASFALDAVEDVRQHLNFTESASNNREANFNQGSRSSSGPEPLPDEIYQYQVDDCPDEENFNMDEGTKPKSRRESNSRKKNNADGIMKKKISKEERFRAAEEKKLKREQDKIRAAEEKKQKREQEKQQRATMKAEAAELKKLQQWEKGKFATKSVVAEIDAKVVELGSIGGHLLTRFAEKGLSFRIKSNPIERSIMWTLTIPEDISQAYSKTIEISYIALVYEAEDFCNLLMNGSLLDHVNSVRYLYPSHTICYLTNRLLAYVNKREQEQYKNPAGSRWKRPPVEEVLAKLTTNYSRVHSRQCIDEAEVAEHIVGLTSSLASCQFRKKLTRLSVNANGSVVSKDAADRNIIKNNVCKFQLESGDSLGLMPELTTVKLLSGSYRISKLKSLVSIPKVQPRFAIAISKKYPTMKSLLRVYMDPNKSVHEKEFLLKDLVTEGLLGGDRRLGEVCSKRVYRILMAQSGSIKTDDVEDGADFFRS